MKVLTSFLIAKEHVWLSGPLALRNDTVRQLRCWGISEKTALWTRAAGRATCRLVCPSITPRPVWDAGLRGNVKESHPSAPSWPVVFRVSSHTSDSSFRVQISRGKEELSYSPWASPWRLFIFCTQPWFITANVRKVEVFFSSSVFSVSGNIFRGVTC